MCVCVFLCIPVISMSMYSIIVYRCIDICAIIYVLHTHCCFEITPDSADLVQLLLDARPVDVVVLQAHPGSAKQFRSSSECFPSRMFCQSSIPSALRDQIH